MAERPGGQRQPPGRNPGHNLAEGKTLAEALPELLVEADRVAGVVLAGWHGRRRAGPGETFWQFRAFLPGEAAAGIDWRRSARDEHLYVREKEWEAAHTVWLAPDLSASMDFRSRLSPAGKRDRAVVLTLALADMLSRAGERVGLLGRSAPLLSRRAPERLAALLAGAGGEGGAAIDVHPLRRFTDLVVLGDFLDPPEALEADLARVAATGARAHLVQVVDPVEETFPFAGRTEFHDPETGARHVLGRAEDYRQDYQSRLAARRARLAGFCRRLGWSFLVHRTDRPATEPLLALHARLADRGERFAGAGRAA